jgi:hypothetical protein
MKFDRLIEGEDWEPQGNWPLILKRDVVVQTNIRGKEFVFSSNGKLFGGLSVDGTLRIYSGYACDGYSPVLKVFGKFVRLTPTPKCGMLPAVAHDFTRQFAGVEGCPWDRHFSDTLFFDLLVLGGSGDIASIYHGAVAGKVGDLFIAISRKKDKGLSVTRLI